MLVPIVFSAAILYLLAYNYLSRITPRDPDLVVSRRRNLALHRILEYRNQPMVANLAHRKDFVDAVFPSYGPLLFRDMLGLARSRPLSLRVGLLFVLFGFVYAPLRLRRRFRTNQRDLAVLIGATLLMCRVLARGTVLPRYS